jgi:hypothetical protein
VLRSRMTVKLPELEKEATIYCIADLNDYEDIGGIYRIYSETGKILYVGKAKCFKSRVGAHLRGTTNTSNVSHLFHYAEIFELKNEVDRDIYETYLINKLKPKYNVSKVYYSRKESTGSKKHKDNGNHTSNSEWLAQLQMIPPDDIEEYKRYYGKEAI